MILAESLLPFADILRREKEQEKLNIKGRAKPRYPVRLNLTGWEIPCEPMAPV